MIVALDVGYRRKDAKAAGVIFKSWDEEEIVDEQTVWIHDIAGYVPGKFYKRELPCLMAILREIRQPLACVVIDGFVSLGKDDRPGLGHYVWECLGGAVPVIGVAKSPFKETPGKTELIRRPHSKPLYVTAMGIDLEAAKEHIRSMKGPFRLPTLLKYVDKLSRL